MAFRGQEVQAAQQTMVIPNQLKPREERQVI